MEIGMIGMGRMGGSMAKRLGNGGHHVVAYDRDPDIRQQGRTHGLYVADSIEGLVSELQPPRNIWLMVPSGNPTEATISILEELLNQDDLVIDGGNSHYKDSMRRGAMLRRSGIALMDVGVSGGVWGLEEGYCMMVGGDPISVSKIRPILETLASSQDKGYAHVGALGSGHFVKMIHNGIEYGLMQAYAEGFEMMRAKDSFVLDVSQIAELWRHGSVIRSWLLDITASALESDSSLSQIQPWVEDSGEGRWAVEESVELAVPVPVMAMALQARFRSRQSEGFGFKLLAAMRQRFGGHSIRSN